MNSTVDALNALSIFGPRQGGAYREHAQAAREVLGRDIQTKIQGHVVSWASSGSPGTLILTGNAGTGKTALAESFCDQIGAELPTVDEITEVAPAVFVVKDFSGVDASQRAEVLDLEASIRSFDRNAQLFLCANEGVLRDAVSRDDDAELEACISTALNEGAFVPSENGAPLTILNLNRQRWTGTAVWTLLMDYLTRESLWIDCDGCAASPNCPMLENAKALRRQEVRDSTRRLLQFASGGSVATLRQLLAIFSYAITGGKTCDQVRDANGTEIGAESAFFNLIFGEGLTADRIERSALLGSIRETLVGDRSDVEIDGWLRDATSAPVEVRDALAPDDRPLHSTLITNRGPMSFATLGEVLTISDDVDEVEQCLADFAVGKDFLSLWRRKVFFELQSVVGGRVGAFSRLTSFNSFGHLLDLSDSVRRGLDTSESKQQIVKGLNYLAAGFHAGGGLVVPELGSLAARNPGSFKPPSPSMVHTQIDAERLHLATEDGDQVSKVIDTDDVRVVLIVDRVNKPSSRLMLTPRLYEAVCESAEFRAPVGSDIPEMNELRIFYGELADGDARSTLAIVDPIKESIRPVTLPVAP